MRCSQSECGSNVGLRERRVQNMMSVCEGEECGSNVGLREKRVQNIMSVFERATIDVKCRISRGGSTS